MLLQDNSLEKSVDCFYWI